MASTCTPVRRIAATCRRSARICQIRKRCDLARSFGVPVLINSSVRDGSLRAEATSAGVRMLLYEAGEALRYDELAIRVGVEGVLNVMRGLGMIVRRTCRTTRRTVRRALIDVGARAVERRGDHASQARRSRRRRRVYSRKSAIRRIFSKAEPIAVIASTGGVIIGRTQLPLVNEGDALFHIARFEDAQRWPPKSRVSTRTFSIRNSSTES